MTLQKIEDDIRQTIRRGERAITDQTVRIHRQRELIAELARHGRGEALRNAQARLKSMLKAFSALQAELEEARRRLIGRIEPLNEIVMDDVARDCPL